MKYLWLSLISALCLLRASSYNITGSWNGSWQNNPNYPNSMNITEINSTTLNATYYFPNFPQPNNSTLIQTTATTWIDNQNRTMTYDPNTNTIIYPFLFQNG